MRTPSSALPAAPKAAVEGGGSPATPLCGAGFFAAGFAATAGFFAADFTTGFLAAAFLATAFLTAFLAAGFAALDLAFTLAFALRVAIAGSSRLLLLQHALRIEIADAAA